MKKQGVLLVNLGTPDAENPSAVRRYLSEFLNDSRIIDLPQPLRFALVNFLIIPLRYKKTARAYQQIWGEKGSPLLYLSQQLKKDLSKVLGPQYEVELGMRYGNPSLYSAINKLKHYDSLIVLPLYPQYSSAATGSALEAFHHLIKKEWNLPAIKIKNDFYADEGFIESYGEMIRQTLVNKKNELLIFSYHGLPERHINKSKCVAACDKIKACPAITSENRYCYRAQCYATSQAIANYLQLTPDQYTVSFQSRLGRTPWIKPYTDLLLPQLAKRGLKHIAMVSPSFVTDCLETLEEIDIRTRKAWEKLGGETFIFIPALNHSPLWIKALAKMITA